MRGPRRWLLLPVLAALLLPGCLDPYRIVVDAGALSRTGQAWQRHDYPQDSKGWFGPNTVETDYTLSPSTQPPYPGVLQLFALRQDGRRATADLLALARASVDNATAANHIEVEGQGSQGGRTLRNGLSTQWFALEGTVKAAGGLFKASTRVRILGEVGYDGDSSTHLIAVGIAQTESTSCPPIVGPCTTRTDLTTWNVLAGDAEGSVALSGQSGAVNVNGLVDNLVSHD